jgi:hypothetical protein
MEDKMQKRQSIMVSDGRIKHKISLYEGNITDLGPEDPVDLLVVSAFPNNYMPTEHSLIGALFRDGLSVDTLAKSKEIDLRTTSGFWLSREIGEEFNWRGARRLAVFESAYLGSPPEAVAALFRGLFPFLSDEREQTVAMPILASGDQGWPAFTMLEALLDASIEWMRRGLPISELMIFVRDQDRIDQLLSQMKQRAADSPVRGVSDAAPTYDIFLSFSSKNANAADAFKQEFVSVSPHATVFDFRLSIDKGQSYQNEIDLAIESCKKVVPILSPAYIASPECQEELNIARLRNKRSGWKVLIPIYWQKVAPDLPLWLQTLNRCDCIEERYDLLPAAAHDVSRAL